MRCPLCGHNDTRAKDSRPREGKSWRDAGLDFIHNGVLPAAAPVHAPPSVRSPQPHEQRANTPTKAQGDIRLSFDNAPHGMRISASASGTAFKLDAGRDVKGDVGSALWGTSFSHEPAPTAADDGFVCRAPDIYAHASSSPLLDSTGFGGHSLDGLPKVIPGSANRGLPVHHAAPQIKRDVPAAPKPTVSKTADDHPGFWGSLWHGTEFTAGLLWGFAKETVSTVAGMARAGLDLTVGAPIALWSDIIHEEPPSYIPNANRVLRPLGALIDKGWDYAHSDHFHPIDDTANWAWNGIEGRYQDIVGKWNSGDYFGSGTDTGETTSDVVTTVATVGTGGGAALRAVKGAADLEVVARGLSKLRRMSGAGSRLPDVLPPTPDVPPLDMPPPTAPDVPPYAPDVRPPTARRTPPPEAPPPPPPRPKIPDAPPKMGPPVKPGTLTGSLKGRRKHEIKIIKDILAQGYDVETVPETDVKTPDIKVGGVVTEFKTMHKLGLNTLKNEIEEGLEQSNDQILIDARDVDFKPGDVVPQIKRVEGKIRKSLEGRITVWTRYGSVRY